MNLADGSPTSLYYFAREVNREFFNVAKELQPLKSLAVYHTGTKVSGGIPLPDSASFSIDPQNS